MKIHRFLLTVLAVAFLSGSLYAADANTIKANMKARLPKITELLKSAKVGENNQGFLTVLDKNLAASDRKVVDAENADRKEVYAAIAKQQKATPEQVGKRRAAQIAGKAGKGMMLQNVQGQWKKK